ncbi:MAG: NAD(P)H-hydrate dehydratase [Lentisphaeria bacterium]|nr:NAD(P)H-hydrate dehydratase [Lentisphaeria bacterium]NQZ68896.1 NAD(P)H-hydrate dehydratase [Lentisphaeria bacterium]
MKAVTTQQMEALDQGSIKKGIPGEVLMERAGAGAFDHIANYCETQPVYHWTHFLILTGKGNNAGDGFVIARYLDESYGAEISVFSACDPFELKGDAERNFTRMDLDIYTDMHELDILLVPGTVIIDCLLGIGMKGPLREPYKTIIEKVNAAELPVFSIDIPSGLDADTGLANDSAIVADCTITMGLPKTGLVLNDGPKYTGRLKLIDIGLVNELVEKQQTDFEITFESEIDENIKRIDNVVHKGTQGRITCIGNSTHYTGALILAAHAALKCGSGLVTAAYPQSLRAYFHAVPNALIHLPLADSDTAILSLEAKEELFNHLSNQDIIAIGPGLGRDKSSLELMAEILKSCKQPIVVDADALDVLTIDSNALNREALTVITPHPGEFKRMLKALKIKPTDSDLDDARTVAKRLDCILVLKGSRSIVVDPQGNTAYNSSGDPALATAGSGDVLCGMIASFLHQIDDPFTAVKTAVFIHGYAGELAKCKRSLIADELLDLIPHALRLLSPFA